MTHISVGFSSIPRREGVITESRVNNCQMSLEFFIFKIWEKREKRSCGKHAFISNQSRWKGAGIKQRGLTQIFLIHLGRLTVYSSSFLENWCFVFLRWTGLRLLLFSFQNFWDFIIRGERDYLLFVFSFPTKSRVRLLGWENYDMWKLQLPKEINARQCVQLGF